MVRLLALIAFALSWIPHAGATTFSSCHPNSQPGYIAIDPVFPDATQPITITVSVSNYIPVSLSIQVLNDTIDVTLTGNVNDFTSIPPICASSVIGPLAPHNYVVKLSVVDLDSPQQGTVFLTSSLLNVIVPNLVSCNAEGLPAGYLAVEPAVPDSTQPIKITVGKYSYDPQSVSVQVKGDTIDVTLIAGYIGFLPPPPTCLTTVVGPLASGNYTVRLSLFDPGAPHNGTTFLTSTALAVGVAGAVLCHSENLPGYLAVDPAAPDFSHPIAITVGKNAYDPKSVSAQVQGNTIDVTLNATFSGSSPPPPSCITAVVGPLAAGNYTVKLSLFDPNSPQSGTVFLTSAALDVSGPGPLTGLWWNSAESGWGISFSQRRNIVFAAWYAYDNAGDPKWYVASDCELAAAGASQSCTDDLYEVKGPTFFASAFNPSAEILTKVGSLNLNFADANAGSMTYVVGGQTRTVPITRQPLRAGPAPSVDYTDLWWNPGESGWGMAIAQQSSVMFLAWYVYDGAGNPLWYVASSCEVIAPQNGCTGTLYRTTGPAFGPTFDSSQVHVVTAGTVSVTFSDSNSGILSYTVNGVTATKSITRQAF